MGWQGRGLFLGASGDSRLQPVADFLYVCAVDSLKSQGASLPVTVLLRSKSRKPNWNLLILESGEKGQASSLLGSSALEVVAQPRSFGSKWRLSEAGGDSSVFWVCVKQRRGVCRFDDTTVKAFLQVLMSR